MTTDQLHRCLRRDVEVLAAANAALWIAAAVPLLLVPAQTASLLGAEPDGFAGARLVGAALAALGVALAAGRRRPLAARLVAGIAIVDGLLALAVLVAPFALRLSLGFLAWLIVGAIALKCFAGATAWFFVRDRLVGSRPRPAVQAPPAGVPADPEPRGTPPSSSS